MSGEHLADGLVAMTPDQHIRAAARCMAAAGHGNDERMGFAMAHLGFAIAKNGQPPAGETGEAGIRSLRDEDTTEAETYAEVEADLRANGHGWLVNRADGHRARCGGTRAICSVCAAEQRRLEAAEDRALAERPRVDDVAGWGDSGDPWQGGPG